MTNKTEENMQRIFEKIEQGAYTNTAPRPSRPVEPEVLNTRAGDLTEEEMSNLLSIAQEYAVALDKYYHQMCAYNDNNRLFLKEFADDLAAAFGLTNNVQTNALFRICFDRHRDDYKALAERYRVSVELLNLSKS